MMTTLQKSFTQLMEFQHQFRGDAVTSWMRENYDVVLYLAFGYVGFVHLGQRLMRDRHPLNLKPLFTLWNFFLALFSALGCFHVVPYFLTTLHDQGERFVLCEHPHNWYLKGAPGVWMSLFIWSKIPELIDTVFLVLQKKPVIFLHWYHHTTVMLYCWFAYAFSVPCGIWYGAMNYFVHSIMYTYYFMMNLSGLTRSLVKPFAPLITFLQIAQMVGGLYVAGKSQMVLWDAQASGEHCDARPAETRMALVMYSTYFVLFAQLFYRLYIRSARKAKVA